MGKEERREIERVREGERHGGGMVWRGRSWGFSPTSSPPSGPASRCLQTREREREREKRGEGGEGEDERERERGCEGEGSVILSIFGYPTLPQSA